MVLLGGIQTLDRPDRRRIRVHLAPRHRHATDRFLARPARRRDPDPGPGLSRRHCRRAGQGARRLEETLVIILSVRNLSKSFGGVRALDNVGFDLGEGEFLALIGPNGAGKSTCFNIINGQMRPDAGEVRFCDRDIVGLPPRDIWRLGIARTFQIAATFGSMTAIENVQLALANRPWRGLSLRHGAAASLEGERAQSAPAGRHGRCGRPRLQGACLWRREAGRARGRACQSSRAFCSWTSPQPAWRRASAMIS